MEGLSAGLTDGLVLFGLVSLSGVDDLLGFPTDYGCTVQIDHTNIYDGCRSIFIEPSNANISAGLLGNRASCRLVVSVIGWRVRGFGALFSGGCCWVMDWLASGESVLGGGAEGRLTRLANRLCL